MGTSMSKKISKQAFEKPVRIFFAIGPEDVKTAYQAWEQGEDSPSVNCMSFTGQFLDICKEIDAEGYVLAPCEENYFLETGQFTIDLRKVPFPKASGIWFHIKEICHSFSLIFSIINFRADVVILDLASPGIVHWYLFCLLKLFNIDIITDTHCLLWYKYLSINLKDKILLEVGKGIFSIAKANLVCSHEIEEQISELTLDNHAPILPFFCSYRPDFFLSIPAPSLDKIPFRVLYLGRIERNKGVFDLLDIARRLALDEGQPFTFDVCGDGGDLEELRAEAKYLGLDQIFVCHGWCNRVRSREIFSRSHVVIVPTRKDFREGFNRVICESVLAGRPVITSDVCPALSYVKDAAIEVQVENVEAYGDAILSLYKESDLYEQKVHACFLLRKQFFDPENQWKAVLKKALVDI